MDIIEKEKPELNEQRTQQIDVLNSEKKNLNHEKDLFEKRKETIRNSISQLNGKLKDSAKQRKYYDSININELIIRVSANEEKKLELDFLKNERAVLMNQFGDISNKYDALIKEQEHQLNAFITQKENQKVEIERAEIQYISALNSEYEKRFVLLEKEHETEINDKENELARRRDAVHQLDKQKVAIKHTQLYEKEIEQVKKQLSEANLALKQETNNIATYKQQIETLQTKWNFEIADAEQNNIRRKEKLQEDLNSTLQKRSETEDKINKSKDSLYGWLNNNKPGWENTIGKVIDEDLLFRDGLSPKLLSDSSSCFGLEINLNEVALKIKTIDDYRFELSKFTEQIEQYQKDIQELTGALEKEKEKIQRRSLPKIKALKENVRQARYQCEQLKRQIEKSELNKHTFTNKASNEKLLAIEKIQADIDRAIVLREEAAGAGYFGLTTPVFSVEIAPL